MRLSVVVVVACCFALVVADWRACWPKEIFTVPYSSMLVLLRIISVFLVLVVCQK